MMIKWWKSRGYGRSPGLDISNIGGKISGPLPGSVKLIAMSRDGIYPPAETNLGDATR
jgi:hypothetical protein